MSAEKRFTLVNQLNILLLVVALAFGIAAAVSFSFHVGVAQNLSRLDKIVYFLFAAVPFATLFYLVLHKLTRLTRASALLGVSRVNMDDQ